jgi:hypothetical protein
VTPVRGPGRRQVAHPCRGETAGRSRIATTVSEFLLDPFQCLADWCVGDVVGRPFFIDVNSEVDVPGADVVSTVCIPKSLGDLEVDRPSAEEIGGWLRDTQNVL